MLVVVDRDHCLRHGGLHNVDTAPRHMDCEQSHTAAQTCFRGEHSGTHLAVAAGYEQGMTVVAFIAFRIAVVEEIGSVHCLAGCNV